MIRSFRDLQVWQKGMNAVAEIYFLTKDNAFSRDVGLRDQLRRSAVSIPSNIAEGFERKSKAEFRRFIAIALGSTAELLTQIEISQRSGYISSEQLDLLDGSLNEVAKMLQSLKQKTI
jgi:four helix bundle protein